MMVNFIVLGWIKSFDISSVLLMENTIYKDFFSWLHLAMQKYTAI